MTLQTVADHVGVSRMTVSNAFSRPDQLSADLRRRILEAADELGYAGPDPAARALARGTTGAVGVLLTDNLQDAFTDEVAALFFGAVARELESSGLALTLLSSSGDTGGSGHIPARDIPLDGPSVSFPSAPPPPGMRLPSSPDDPKLAIAARAALTRLVSVDNDTIRPCQTTGKSA